MKEIANFREKLKNRFKKIKNLKKSIDIRKEFCYTIICRHGRHQIGRIAQLGEHLPYKQGVTGSSPVVPTNLAR